jgi:hypothetical protein
MVELTSPSCPKADLSSRRPFSGESAMPSFAQRTKTNTLSYRLSPSNHFDTLVPLESKPNPK